MRAFTKTYILAFFALTVFYIAVEPDKGNVLAHMAVFCVLVFVALVLLIVLSLKKPK